MRNFWYNCLSSNYDLILQQKGLYLCFQEQKTDLIYLVKNTFYKMFCPKNPKYFFKFKLRIIFLKIRKKYLGHNSKKDKDISKIPTDSSSAGQQQKDN